MIEFKHVFGAREHICNLLVHAVQSLGMQRSKCRSMIRDLYDAERAQKLVRKKKKLDIEQLKLASTYAEVQKIEYDNKKRQCEEKEAQLQSKKKKKEEYRTRKLQERQIKKYGKTCKAENCSKLCYSGKSWMSCDICKVFNICAEHKAACSMLFEEHSRSCLSKD